MINPEKIAERVFHQYEIWNRNHKITFDGEHLRRLTQCIVDQMCMAVNNELEFLDKLKSERELNPSVKADLERKSTTEG